MSRAAARFRQSDLEKVLRAVRAAGLPATRTEVGRDGKIVVFHKADDAIVPAEAALRDWEAKQNANSP
jgi:hypothetical protein